MFINIVTGQKNHIRIKNLSDFSCVFSVFCYFCYVCYFCAFCAFSFFCYVCYYLYIMNSNCQILPGIKKLYWVDCDKLPTRIDLYAAAGMKVALLAELNEITFFGFPECKCTTEKVKNGWKQEASLKFLSSDDIPLFKNIAFVVTDVSDESYIIGFNEHPFPTVKREYNMAKPGDKAGFNYEISHSALRSMVKCLI